jgi:hypothetical protein
MDSFSGVEKVTWCAGRGKCGAYFPADDAGFADTAYYAGAAAVVDHFGSLGKRSIDNRSDCTYCVSFGFNHFPCIVKVKFHCVLTQLYKKMAKSGRFII